MLQKTLGRPKIPVVARITGVCFLLRRPVVPRMRQGFVPCFHGRVVPWRYVLHQCKRLARRCAHVREDGSARLSVALPPLNRTHALTSRCFFRAAAGIEWILEECSSHGASAFVAFMCFTSLMLAVQVQKVSRILFAPSIDSVRSTLGFQVLFSMIFVVRGKCSPTPFIRHACTRSVFFREGGAREHALRSPRHSFNMRAAGTPAHLLARLTSRLPWHIPNSPYHQGKCAWTRATNRAINESVLRSIFSQQRDLIIMSEASFMTLLLLKHYMHSPWRGKGRRMQMSRDRRKDDTIRGKWAASPRSGALARETRRNVGEGGKAEASACAAKGDTDPASPSPSMLVGGSGRTRPVTWDSPSVLEKSLARSSAPEEHPTDGISRQDPRELERAKERARVRRMESNLTGQARAEPQLAACHLSAAERAALHLSAVAPFSSAQ